MSGSRGGLDRVLNHTVLQRGVLLLHSQGNASFSAPQSPQHQFISVCFVSRRHRSPPARPAAAAFGEGRAEPL